MSLQEVYLCDVCEQDGEKILAVANYVNDEGECYSCCNKHLKDVKKANLGYQVIEGMEITE